MTTPTQAPLVSVVMPAFNAARFLADSVASVVAQTHRDVELLIVDDGSSDNTVEMAESLARDDGRVRLIRSERNVGTAAARNLALHVLRGEYVCFLDADDAFLPNKIETQLAFLHANQSFGLVYSDLILGNEKLEPIRLNRIGVPPLAFPELLTLRNWFQPIAPMLTASLVRAVGGFDETLTPAEDWDYWIRCAALTRFGYLPGPVAVYRSHPGQTSRQSERMRIAQERLINKHFGKARDSYGRARAARHLELAKNSKRQPLVMMRELALFARAIPAWRDVPVLLRVVQ
ncbi:MAG TPA: glycosyltransferase family A protein [Gemmatimonadaceae bacterium]